MYTDINELSLFQAQAKDFLKAFSANKSYENRILLIHECKPVIARYLTTSCALYAYLKSSSYVNEQIQTLLKRHSRTMRKEVKIITAFYLKYGTPDVVDIAQFQTDFSLTHRILYKRIQVEKTHLIPEYQRIKRDQHIGSQTQPILQPLTT